jgi:hypothetical protein
VNRISGGVGFLVGINIRFGFFGAGFFGAGFFRVGFSTSIGIGLSKGLWVGFLVGLDIGFLLGLLAPDSLPD